MKVKLSMQEELDMSRLQVKQLNDLVSEADEIVKVSKLPSIDQNEKKLIVKIFLNTIYSQDKEREVVQLTESIDRDRMLIKVGPCLTNLIKVFMKIQINIVWMLDTLLSM